MVPVALVPALVDAAQAAHAAQWPSFTHAQCRGLALLEAALWGVADIVAQNPGTVYRAAEGRAFMEALRGVFPDVQTLPECAALCAKLDAVEAALNPTCDCGHPATYHGLDGCGWAPPHSDRRCRCMVVTTTGVARDDTYSRGA